MKIVPRTILFVALFCLLVVGLTLCFDQNTSIVINDQQIGGVAGFGMSLLAMSAMGLALLAAAVCTGLVLAGMSLLLTLLFGALLLMLLFALAPLLLTVLFPVILVCALVWLIRRGKQAQRSSDSQAF
ncbi:MULTISPECIES: hypothetical protein [unclassified Undibacterium]|uniref:hypothetical protein n=1 Tax=unclassified Undibacterium TaxID=2630295 RepID=UPI002AC94891|nr:MULTISPECIES: hypothetical protein [unclassified Undibacterium]MEB0139066.1 hypothetical protein [Undibacterium sp. CCC2.1]MEB0172977.1 hypothetical protein [Undibacterium sp. CCC1.1]MEB0177299.1 hypothetical protein [Undibacterium sp. CCC3.4]MEB0215895.1 hypothetical protein [Undibacterium sp. 5I2]WPX42096.1 hypothetical protein RHM61_11825 [Undibacterium sp. CCC3.4]